MLMNLMPNWNTLKSLLRVYAHMDGVELFRSSKPRLATQAAQPYAAEAAQWLRSNTDSGVLVGTARFAMMLPAGMVDFLGPVAEERPAQALVRIGGEMLNGVTALTTRFASLAVGSASQLPQFDRTAAWTEWGLSAATFFWGAETLVKPRPPMSTPAWIPIVTHYESVAGVKIPYAIPKLDLGLMMVAKHGTDGDSGGGVAHNGKVGKVPDKDRLLALYHRFHGKVVQIADSLGVTRAAIYNAFERYGLKNLLPVRQRRSKPEVSAQRTLPSKDNLAMAYVTEGYNWNAVADKFGFSHATMYNRISDALKNGPSLLKALVEVQRRLVTPITDVHIEAVLIVHRLDLERSAAFLGMSVAEVMTRLQNAPHGSSLHLMSGLRPK
jgi:transposase